MVKKTKKQGNNYFTEETEDSIVRYNNEEDNSIKNTIYEHFIHYPLYKLTQNIIHTFKFYHTEVEDLEHLQHELIIFVLSKIHLFNPAKSVEDKIAAIYKANKLVLTDVTFQQYLIDNGLGNHSFKLSNIKDYLKIINPPEELRPEFLKINIPKAYSYFGTMIKRWLILYNNKNYNNKIINVPIYNDSDDNSQDFLEDNLGLESETETYHDGLDYFIEKYTEFCSGKINELFPKKLDAQIADAILSIFKNKQNIDIFEKKALYIYIREIIDVKTPKITHVAKQLYSIFKKNYVFYLENDYIDFKI